MSQNSTHLLKASDIQVMQWDDAGGYSYNFILESRAMRRPSTLHNC